MGNGTHYSHIRRKGDTHITLKQANRLGLLDDKYINVRSVRGNYERITYKRIIDGVTYIFTRYEKRKGTEKRFKV